MENAAAQIAAPRVKPGLKDGSTCMKVECKGADGWRQRLSSQGEQSRQGSVETQSSRQGKTSLASHEG